jgi:hypothetical protein
VIGLSMDLSEHQRKLLGMIKGTYHPTGDDEPYLQALTDSDSLGLVREIATWWRIYDLERYCALTARLLKQRRVYESTVDRFVKTHAISPYINELGEAFLQDMSASEDGLLAELAAFELALTRVKRGSLHTYTLLWQHDPAALLTSLVQEIPIPVDVQPGDYRVTVSAGLPGMFSIESM